MALSSSTIFEINSGATAGNVNSGGFNPSNANFLTDLTTDANTANTSAPVCSSASYNFIAGDVGHWLYIKSGTNWIAGWYQIASVASNKATLSAAIGSSTVRIVKNNLFGANTETGCATVGTPTGGVFTIDYSQSTASPFASTDLVLATTTTLTSAANPFTAAMVGNLIHITAGTGFTVGWYEIVSVSGTTATIDRVGGTLASTGGTGKVGGALSLGSSDDAIFELMVNSTTDCTRYFFKGNATYVLGGTVTMAADASTSYGFPGIFEGYASNRGDRPTGNTRPVFDCGASSFSIAGINTYWHNIEFKGSNLSGTVVSSSQVSFFNCKFSSTQTNSSGRALQIDNGPTDALFCEFVNPRGTAVNSLSNGTTFLYGCYIHDSNSGFTSGQTSAGTFVIGCIFAGCIANAVSLSGANTNQLMVFENNTIVGWPTPRGTGILKAASNWRTRLLNNIIYGFVTGVDGADNSNAGISGNNNFYNNTSDVGAATEWQKSLTDISLDPAFTNVVQRTGSTATTTAGNHLVQSGATFQTWGVTAGRDYVYISGGTGVTVGIYDILSVDSETQITSSMTLSANATADKTWWIITGRDFSVGTNMKAVGAPGVFPGGHTTGYLDIGAVQRQEPAGGSGLASNPVGGFVS